MQAPVLVLNTTAKRESGRKAQLSNVKAAKAVADIIRTCLGPQSMLKMVLDPMGGIVMTNDGNAILREIDVSHPAAKSMLELSRAQDEEVGDGTTSVIIMAGELLAVAEPFLERGIHPSVIHRGYYKAMEDSLKALETIAFEVDRQNREDMLRVIRSTLSTKFVHRWSELMCNLALDAVMTVAKEDEQGKTEIDIKRYAKIEKIPGGSAEDSLVLDGLMLNKDITHPKMRRYIENPRIVLLDCPVEYKKGESAAAVEMTKDLDLEDLLKQEEEHVERMVKSILALKPDIVITEKGIADLAQHYFMKAGVSCIRRLRKSDNNRVARVCGATIVHRPEELLESDIGTEVGLFEIKKIGDEYFSFLTKCKNPKACTILLRGASKDVLNEIERNLHDAMNVTRNVYQDPRLVPGGGAAEIGVSTILTEKAGSIPGVEQWPYRAVAEAMEVIPRTLVQNCGGNVIRSLTELRAKHHEKNDPERHNWGINGDTGVLQNMRKAGVHEPLNVKLQTMKTAIEAAGMLLRIDDIVSGISKAGSAPAGGPPPADEDQMEQETFGDNRDG